MSHVSGELQSSSVVCTGLRNRLVASFLRKAALVATIAALAGAALTSAERPLPRPSNPHVGFDQYSLRIDGKPVFLTSGEFEYWRLPSPGLWPQIMSRMIAAGMNTITVYLPWAYHSPAPDVYDFTGIRDLDLFLRDAEKAGLYVIARPGPFVDAESYGGQIPGWLFTSKAPFRSDDPGYVAAVAQWYDHVLPIVARHQIGHGGSVILMQIENELIKGDAKFIEALYRMARNQGIDIPLIHNDVPLRGDPASVGIYSSIVDISTPDNYPGNFECVKPWTVADIQREVDPLEHLFRDLAHQTTVPLLIGEYQGGSFDPYGGVGYQACYDRLGPQFVDVAYKSLVAQGATGFNQYMFYGGTTWGYMPNALVYTSYDFGAPVREWFEIGTRYGATKRLGYFVEAAQPEIARTSPGPDIARSSNSAVSVRGRVNPENGTQFLFVRNDDDTREESTRLELKSSAGALTIPQHGALHLGSHGMKILLGHYARPWGTLDYSTSELLTNLSSADAETIVLWGDTGDEGETQITVPYGNATVSASPGIVYSLQGRTLLLRYRHRADLQCLRLSKGNKRLRIILADRYAADRFWRVKDGGLVRLVYGGYLVEPASNGDGIQIQTRGGDRDLQVFSEDSADDNHSGRMVRVNGKPVAGRVDTITGGFRFTLPESSGAAFTSPVLPELGKWSFVAEPFEAAPEFDDKDWSEVNQYHSFSPDSHDFSYGFVWYRGKFRGPRNARFLRLKVYDSYSVWLNGHFLGRGDDGATSLFALPPAILNIDGDNTLAILAESIGRAENTKPSGLVQADFLAERNPVETLHLDPLSPEGAKQIELTPEWTKGSDGFWGDAVVKTAHKAGARARFSFRGPLLRILGPYDADRGQADVFIDGKRAGAIDASRPPWDGGSGPLFERIGWDEGEHTAEIVVTGRRLAEAGTPGKPDAHFAISGIEMGPVASAALQVDIRWKLQGADASTRTEQLSPYNGSGLYGELHGWSTKIPESLGEKQVTLPNTFSGDSEWVGWYTKNVSLDLPDDGSTELGIEFDGAANHGDKAVLYVNGFLYGRYWPEKGPQTRFFLPRGVWKPGPNRIAIAVWRRNTEGGHLGRVRLIPMSQTHLWSVDIR